MAEQIGSKGGLLRGTDQTQRFLLIGASVFAFVAAAAFVYGIGSIIYSNGLSPQKPQEKFEAWRDLVQPYFGTFAVVSIGIICGLFSLILFGRAGSLTSQVIRNEDRELLVPLLREPNVEAISQYIRLASLSGFAGTFTYLGFTGLPLATVVLTLILLLTAIGVSDDDLQKSIFDMAKLTLGAFLGSFVQRNIEQEKVVAGTGIGAGPPPPAIAHPANPSGSAPAAAVTTPQPADGLPTAAVNPPPQ
jgi:hypothetical protein